MNTIKLHGEMAERFGESFTMAARTPLEMLHAIWSQIPSFKDAIREGKWFLTREFPNGEFSLDETSLCIGMDGATVHLFPLVEGAANGKGIGKIVAGVALIGLTIATGGFGGALAFGGFGASGAAAVSWATVVGGLGLSLLLGGAAMMIAPQPAQPSTTTQDQKNSFVFGGPTNTSGQGWAVPIVIGRMMIGSNPVASQIVTEDLSVQWGDTYAFTSDTGETVYY
jgi:predicted phage tail protein